MRVYILAGEASGDRLGAALMAGLQAEHGAVEFRGVAGPAMIAQGMDSQFDMTELSVMGIAEVLPKYRHLKRRIAEVAETVIAWQPDVLITIDSPDFSLRVAKLVKERSDIPTVHYVAPSVWAWRPGRAAKMARHIDHVLALLPMEPPLMRAAGMSCDLVGHPVVAERQATPEEREKFRKDHDITDDFAVFLPGSRQSEVRRLMPIYGQVAERLAMPIVIPAAAPVADLVTELAANWAVTPIIIDPRGKTPETAQHEKRAAFGAAHVALAASGTVSLELAAAGTPMVVAYDMNWLSWQIMSRAALIDTVTLVNIVTDTRHVPEFLGPNCKAPDILEALQDIATTGAKRRDQQQALTDTMGALGRGDVPPNVRAARSVHDFLKRQT